MNNFRPTKFDDVIGQETAKRVLQMRVKSYVETRRVPGHILILGGSGLGKTTLATACATAMNVPITTIMGTRISSWAALKEILIKLQEGEILFIDEIHALKPKIQIELYGVLEDFCYDHTQYISQVATETIKKPLKHFTLMGATTHAGDLGLPLRGRFQMELNLVPYNNSELATMVKKAANRVYSISNFPDDVAGYLGRLSRSNARNAVNLLTNLMEVVGGTKYPVNNDCVDLMVKMHAIDPIIGLDRPSRMYLNALLMENRPVGVSVLSTLINEQEETVKNFVEPFLLSDLDIQAKIDGRIYELRGPLAKMTRSGRTITKTGKEFLSYCKQLQNDGWLIGEKIYTEEDIAEDDENVVFFRNADNR